MRQKEQDQRRGRWHGSIWVALSGYRFLAFVIATVIVFAFPEAFRSVLSPVALVVSVGIYSLLKVLQPSNWYQKDIPSFVALGIDIAICLFLVMSTGGFYSPFLLYSLAPVLTAAVLFDIKVASGVAGISIAYVVASHLYNPFFATQFTLAELSYFFVYLIAVSMAVVLPYLTNVNLRQRQQAQDIMRERHRLAREIHDGMAQTISALSWQAQLLHRRLTQMGIHLDEARQLEELAAQAQHDARESLELLHNYNGDSHPHLQEYLEHLKHDASLNFRLDMPTAELAIDPLVELELLRICQEALTNIRKHSGACNVSIRVRPVNRHLELSIADDGCGFDAHGCYDDDHTVEGHGLRVMKERAESIGGRLTVLSSPGQGTEVQVSVPLARHDTRSWLR